MTYKNTLEIVTKEIQDLEKLLDSFQNDSPLPAIEMDLALSKLRNVYDILLMLKENHKAKSAETFMFTEEDAEMKTQDKPKHIQQDKNLVTTETEEEKSIEINSEEGIIFEEEEEEEEEKKGEVEDSEKAVQEAPVSEPPVDNKQGNTAEKKQAAGVKEDRKSESQTVSSESAIKKSKPTETVLGETFKDNREYVYDKLGGQVQKTDLTSRLQSTPISSIAGSIGINEKFFYIRELFNSNAEDFRETISILDNAHNFNDPFELSY